MVHIRILYEFKIYITVRETDHELINKTKIKREKETKDTKYNAPLIMQL